MKARVTISVSKHSLHYVDRLVGRKGSNRSQVIESFIRESLRREHEAKLMQTAREFFSQPEPEGEAQEREFWLRAGLETLKRDR